jgi:hypothetical protein
VRAVTFLSVIYSHLLGIGDSRKLTSFQTAPTSASWLNAVEGFLAKLAKRRLKRGVFGSIVDLQAAINRFLQETNEHPKPFVWTAGPYKIIAVVKRGYQALVAYDVSVCIL